MSYSRLESGPDSTLTNFTTEIIRTNKNLSKNTSRLTWNNEKTLTGIAVDFLTNLPTKVGLKTQTIRHAAATPAALPF